MKTRRSFVHLINLRHCAEGSGLSAAQLTTFAELLQLRKHYRDGDVTLAMAPFGEDVHRAPEGVVKTPNITRSLADAISLPLEQKLPFVADMLARLYECFDVEYVVYSNDDTIPLPNLYDKITKIIDAGSQAFSFVCRIINPISELPDDREQNISQYGWPQTHYKCFVFPMRFIPGIDVGRIVLEQPWADDCLQVNLALLCPTFRVIDEYFVNRYDDIGPSYVHQSQPLPSKFNAFEAKFVFHRLQSRFGSWQSGTELHAYVLKAERELADVDPDFLSESFIRSEKRKFIFCISSGRAGSEYLAVLLGSCREVTSAHEPVPVMAGRYLEMVMDERKQRTRVARAVKAKVLRKYSAHMLPGQIYAETSHMFFKTFDDVVLQELRNQEVIVVVLRRNLVDVLNSFLELGYFSDMNDIWPKWMHRVPSNFSLFKPSLTWEEMDPCQRSIAYLLDVEAHVQKFSSTYPTIRVVETNLEDLQEKKKVALFLQEIGIEPTEKTFRIIGKKVNKRTGKKNRLGIEVDYTATPHRLQAFIRQQLDSGVTVPRHPTIAAFLDNGAHSH